MDLLGESVCPYCGVGCRLKFEGAQGQVLRVRGVEAAPANLGGMCAKGAQLGPTIHTDDRLSKPQLRLSRHDAFQNVDWNTALRYVAEIFSNIVNMHGPEAVAFYGSGQLDSETVYLISKLFKGYLGCNNTDSNSRLCMAAAVAGYRTSLGSDGPPTCYDDIEIADVIVIMGSNTAEAHPVTFDRIRASKKARPEQQIVVIDPRRTATAAVADLYLPVQPGGDIALLNALGRMLLTMGAMDRDFVAEHTRGFEEYRQFLMAQDIAELCKVAGVPAGELFALASRLSQAKTFLSFYCMGLNQSTVGMWKNNSLINLHLLTGQIGKPGAGPFSLTGQPNAMGGREGGLLSHQLPGYRTVEDDKHRADAEQFWGRSPGTISPKVGLTAVEMFRAMEKGQLKAIWIAGTNPAVSLPDLHHVRRAFQKAQLVVVQDAYHPTETSRLADVILPVAQWGEKEWTSTNSERTVGYSPKLWDPPGEALPDWQIIARFAQTLGFKSFNYASAGEVWDEFIQMTAGRPCDMAGATAARLRKLSSLQWPCPTSDHPGSKRRYLDRKFASTDGRALFLPRDHREPREVPDHEFPFVLTTGRLYAHWHTLTRTAKADKLMKREPQPFVEINPEDAARLQVGEGDLLQISSRRGTVQLPARMRDSVLPGMVFVPFHWGDDYSPGNAANYLTISAIGRVAKQPELKFCAVSLEKIPQAKRITLHPTEATTEPSGPRLRVMWISTIAFTLMFNVWLMLGVLGIPIRNELRLTDSQFEWLIATAILSGSLLRLNFGIWADRYGGRNTMIVLLLLSAIPTYVFSRAESYQALLVCTLLYGLAGNSFTVGISWNSAWFPARQKGTALGVFGAGNVGASGTKMLVFLVPTILTLVPAGGYLGGLIPGGWRFIPALYAALLLVMALVTWWFCPVPDRMPGKGRPMRDMLAPLRYIRVWRLSLYYVVVFGAYVALSGWLPKYYIDTYHVSLPTAALLTASFIFPASLLRPLGGYLSDLYGPRVVTYAVFIVMTICLVILSIPNGEYLGTWFQLRSWAFASLMFVVGCGMGIGKASVYKYVPNYFPNDVGAAGGLVGLLGGLGGFFLPPIFGGLGRWTGVPQTAFLALLALTIASLAWLHLVVVKMRAAERLRTEEPALAVGTLGTRQLDAAARS